MTRLTFKIIPWALAFGLLSPITQANTVIYEGNGSPEASGWLAYGQVPIAESLLPPLPSLPGANLDALLESVVGPLAEGVGTPTLNTDLGSGNEGYTGYANYTYELPDDLLSLINPAEILTGTFDPMTLITAGSFEPVNPLFPILDRDSGFDIAFNVAVNEESSQSNRAGFSLLVISEDGKGIELGFKSGAGAQLGSETETEPDRIFAQSKKFKEAEETTEVDISEVTDYVLTVKGDTYTLFANDTEVLTGDVRKYQFNPLKSDPPLPFNPYTSPSFLFLGDDTDQGYANFTLGTIAVTQHAPELGSAAVNAQGEKVETATILAGGIAINGTVPQTKTEQKLSDQVDVVGTITVDPADVDKQTDVVVYADYKTAPESAEKIVYMLDNAGNILAWDEQPESLVGFITDVTLAATHNVSMYQGEFILPGYLCVYFGYRLHETGTVVTNDTCIEVIINE